MKIAFGSDHAGLDYRRALAQRAKAAGHEVTEFGAMTCDPYDYPDASDLVARELLENRAEFGVLVCGSGIGVDIRANRYRHIRAANCVTVEMAELAREHNHANVLCIGQRLMKQELANQIFDAFLSTPPSEVARHVHRVEKLDSNVS